MAGGRFSKQAEFHGVKLNKSGYLGDTAQGGGISIAPSGLVASQGQQTAPGDRIILGGADVLALTDATTGTLYPGSYRYVNTLATATANPARGRAAFWVSAGASLAQDQLYQVTPDEVANLTVALFAGVWLIPITKGNLWWIQESGKASCSFRATLTGVAAIGQGVYLAGAGAGADVGAFDNILAATTLTDAIASKLVGIAEVLPVANSISLVDLTLNRASYRY